MSKAGITTIILIVLGFVVGGGLYIQSTIGENMNVANVKELIKAQPKLTPMSEMEELPKLGLLPKVEGIDAWINSGGINHDDYKGKVVLFDFMTYSCINCIRTWPFLNQWYDKYHDAGLLMVGIHTPEFDFEKDLDNVKRALKDANIKFPVALDNNYTTWRNFNNRFWPATYIFDQDGVLRYTHFGEGNYDVTEGVIQQLLGVNDQGIVEGSAPDFTKIKSPETYFGWKRVENYAGSVRLDADDRALYVFPETLPLNSWALDGSWIVHKEFAEVDTGPSRIKLKYNAGKVNFVLGTTDKRQRRINVYLDGEPVPKHFAGTNLNIETSTGESYAIVEYAQLYELISGVAGIHTVELEILDPGVQVYSVTFGD